MSKTRTLVVCVPPRACRACGGNGCSRCKATPGEEPGDKATWHRILVDEDNRRVHAPEEAMSNYTKRDLERYRKTTVTPNGVVFDWELAGPHGARFVLFREEHHSDQDIDEAKSYLRRERDVVSLTVERAPT